MMTSRMNFVLSLTLVTASVVHGLSRSSSMSRLFAVPGGSSAQWSEADLLREKALMTSGDDGLTRMPRTVHIKAELLNPKSAFSNAQPDKKIGTVCLLSTVIL